VSYVSKEKKVTMPDWNYRTVVTTVKEYTLPNPTNWAQVRQVLDRIERELPEDRRRWDDTVTVTAHDDEILFSYQVETRTEP
jgi:hypothetical protein